MKHILRFLGWGVCRAGLMFVLWLLTTTEFTKFPHGLAKDKLLSGVIWHEHRNRGVHR